MSSSKPKAPLLPSRRAADNLSGEPPQRKRRKRPSVAKPGPEILVQPGDGGPVQCPTANDVLYGRGGRVNGHPGNEQFRRILDVFRAEQLAVEKKKEKAHVWAKVVRRIRAQQGRFLQQQQNSLWVEVGDKEAIRKVGQAFRDKNSPARPAAAAPVMAVAASNGASATPTPAARPIVPVEPGAGGVIASHERNENDVLSGRGGRIYGYPGNTAYLGIVEQYLTLYHDEERDRAERARVPAQIIHAIRSKQPPGRFLEELASGDWQEIGDTRAIDKVRNALQYNALQYKKTTSSCKAATTEPTSSEVLPEGNPKGPLGNKSNNNNNGPVFGSSLRRATFAGIASEQVSLLHAARLQGATTAMDANAKLSEHLPCNAAASSSPQGLRILVPSRMETLSSSRQASVANLKSGEEFGPLTGVSSSVFGGKQPAMHDVDDDDDDDDDDACFAPPLPKPTAQFFERRFFPTPRPSGITSDASTITSGEFSVISSSGVSIGGLSTASSLADLSDYAGRTTQLEEGDRSARAPILAPPSTLSIDATSTTSPLLPLPDVGSLSSSSSANEARKPPQRKPHHHEPGFASQRMQQLAEKVPRSDMEEDDISDMSGWISGMSLMSRMDRCSIESFSIHTVSTPVPSMDGSF